MKQYCSIGKQWVLRIGVFLLMVLLLMDIGSIVLLASLNGYTLTGEETKLFTFQSITYSKCYELMQEWERYDSYSTSEYNLSPDFRGKTHFRYRILSPDGEILHSTIPQTPPALWMETEHTISVYEHTESDSFGNTWKDQYVYYGSPINNQDTHLYTIKGYYSFDSLSVDLYDLLDVFLQTCYPVRFLMPPLTLVLVIVLAVLWVQLTTHTGHRQYLPDHPQYRGDVVLSFFDRLPYDLYLAVLITLFCFAVALITVLPDLVQHHMLYLAVWAFAGLVYVMIFLLLAAYITTVTRIKAKNLFRNTLVWRLCVLPCRFLRWCWQIIKIPFAQMRAVLSSVPLFWKTALIAPVVLLGYGLFSSLMWGNGGVFFLWSLVSLVLYLLLLYAASCFRMLMKAGKALAEGNLHYKTDTSHMLYSFREHGENLNRIGEGMEIALAEKIKSERLKTELITNVSHDIKTPLTSIISYTDLLSREGLEGKAKEYTEVLSRQSARLKKLIEDLIEASKASTGNIAVSPERLDICQIVRQSLGEYEERMEKRHLQVVQLLPPEEIYAMVDGRQLWRVLDNLYSNVCKYALEGTRVYVVAAEDGGEVTISVKNISRDVLTTAADELTERFVQGDASRSAEGSGLGLNIAKSLTELQNGRFRIHCDGDLFRCDISFPVIP